MTPGVVIKHEEEEQCENYFDFDVTPDLKYTILT